MLILLTLFFFVLKFIALCVIGLFFLEDIELTSSANVAIYFTYVAVACICFFSLLLYFLGGKILWLITFAVTGFFYLTMYNLAPDISSIHRTNNLKSRYFKDIPTFVQRMKDVTIMFNEKFS